MSIFLQTGIALGAAIGLIHAVHLFRQRQRFDGAAEALWFALWAFGLWTLFGAYVLAFWILGALGMALAGMRPAAGAER